MTRSRTALARALPRVVALATLLAAGGAASPAFAQTVDAANEATSRALFDEGRRLMQKGDYAAACGKFEEGQRLAPGIGLKFNLAECYEKVGKVASAWSAYRDVASLARTQSQETRETIATQRADAIEGRVPRLKIVVPDGHRVY
jgi:Flp pilus assembly protein TadD